MRKIVLVFFLSFLGVASYFLVDFMAYLSPRFINKGAAHASDTSLEGSIYIGRKMTGIDYAIVILKELGGAETIQSKAVKTYEEMDLGKFTAGKGILILASENEKQLKVEVGYELEGIFTDALCARIERAARAQMQSGDYRDFLTELIVTMGIYYQESRANAELAEKDFPMPSAGRILLSGGGGIKTDSFQPNYIDQDSILSIENSNDFLPADDVKASIRSYLLSLENGIGTADLPLLTAGSKRYRSRVPRTLSYQQRVYDYYQAAMPYEIYENDKRALVVFKSDSPVYPIFMQKDEAGQWLVDEAGMHAHIHAFEGGKFYFKYKNNPYAFAQRELQTGHSLKNYLYSEAPAYVHLDNDLKELSESEAELGNEAKNAETYFLWGDFYLFTSFDLARALRYYEKGLKIDPHSPYRWRLFDVLLNGTDINAAITQLDILTKEMDSTNYYKVWHELLVSIYKVGPSYYKLRLGDYFTTRFHSEFQAE